MTDVNTADAEVLPCDMQPVDISGSLPRHTKKKYATRSVSDIKRIVVHTTDWDCTAEELAAYDIGPNHISSTGCPAITYHGLIMPNSEWHKTLPYEEVAWHVGPWNTGSVGLALVFRVSDGFGADYYAPKEKQIKSLMRACGSLCLKLGVEPTNIVGHRELKHTGWFWFKGSRKLRKTCPGLRVDMDEVRSRVIKYVQLCLLMHRYYNNSIDGLWGPISKAAFQSYLAERE